MKPACTSIKADLFLNTYEKDLSYIPYLRILGLWACVKNAKKHERLVFNKPHLPKYINVLAAVVYTASVVQRYLMPPVTREVTGSILRQGISFFPFLCIF